MSKRTLTTAQKERAEKRRAQFAALAQQLAELDDAQRTALQEKLNIITCEGHPLSVRNMMIAYLQEPRVTMVGGYRQWQKVGRQVKKGEHSLLIWAPKMKKEKEQAEQSEEGELHGFITVSVFDVSQTVSQTEGGECRTDSRDEQ